MLITKAGVKRTLGKGEGTRRLEAEVAETEALVQALSHTTLIEQQSELKAEIAAAVVASARQKRPMLTRKQQKRKATQRREAKARAAAAAAGATATEAGSAAAEAMVMAPLTLQHHSDDAPYSLPALSSPKPDQ